MKRFRMLMLLSASCFLVPGLCWADDELNRQGFALAKQYCYQCHNGSEFFDITDNVAMIEDGYLAKTDGNTIDLDESEVWQRLSNSTMPPEGQPAPTAEEKELLRKWFVAGAEKPKRTKRSFVSETAVLKSLLEDLKSIQEIDRQYQRYFTLTHLYNNNEQVSDFEMRLYRAALSKAVNSLSWEPELVIPRAINEEQTLFRVDLRDIGWDKRTLWREILKLYPYGMTQTHHPDTATKETFLQIEKLSGTPVPAIRGDWFAVRATRPPLYHTLLEIPSTDQELEKKLGVDFLNDFQRNRIRRAGFAESGVSTANRLLDRHPARIGKYYWKSYDFKKDNSRANLFQFPLGPNFSDNPFSDFAFSHDGGEQIFGLPNGLQGYMLIDNAGNRIDKGPIEVVRDRNETAGSPEVVNGISCMACHAHGMRQFKDTVRLAMGVFGEAKEKSLELFVAQEEMDKLVAQDEARFMAALQDTIGTFLQAEEDRERRLRDFAEPITAIAAIYERDMNLTMAAYELGMENADELKSAIRFNPELKTLGLGALEQGASIQRDHWEDLRQINSPMQKAARILDRGEPYRAF